MRSFRLLPSTGPFPLILHQNTTEPSYLNEGFAVSNGASDNGQWTTMDTSGDSSVMQQSVAFTFLWKTNCRNPTSAIYQFSPNAPKVSLQLMTFIPASPVLFQRICMKRANGIAAFAKVLPLQSLNLSNGTQNSLNHFLLLWRDGRKGSTGRPQRNTRNHLDGGAQDGVG